MRQVTKYSAAIKASVLAKAFAPNPPRVVELSKEFNIPIATIYTWMYNMNKRNVKQVNAAQRPNDKSPEAKLQAVIDTMGMSDQEQSAYCRTNGIYYNHLDSWKKQMLAGLGVENAKENKAEHKQMQRANRQLQRELSRKDKALAEVTALLILKKKADLLWAVDEDV